ncbi:hypothetical protein HMPREF0758_0088 [Serratia odorifera DSM 4582]|uniref:Uncharacterized protein n=1 Tax=Serratia odorifera DSM 4582 TaxID=667129 RepID=D4DVY8_SEROD|nr:hypothetical protein HMPREF0758_0088 [Serratia odorifera DSM 4582]
MFLLNKINAADSLICGLFIFPILLGHRICTQLFWLLCARGQHHERQDNF